MPPLNNARHERFVQLLLQGENATDAHEQAGYVRDDGNATRLRANPKVQERLTELQAEVVKDTKITVEGLLGELEDARKKATDLEQLSAAVRAIESKAKISGLLVERQKVEITGSLDQMTDPHEIALAVADHCLEYKIEPYHDFTSGDRERLAELFLAAMNDFGEAVEELIKEVHARPLKNSYHPPPRALPSPYGNGKAKY